MPVSRSHQHRDGPTHPESSQHAEIPLLFPKDRGILGSRGPAGAPLQAFLGGGKAVLIMELPRRHSTPLGGGAGSHPLRVQTMGDVR